MAGIDENTLRNENTDERITEWILEYVYEKSWNTFKEHKTVDKDGVRDILQCKNLSYSSLSLSFIQVIELNTVKCKMNYQILQIHGYQ